MSKLKIGLIIIFIIIVMLLLLINNSKHNKHNKYEQFTNTDIDVVITWVDATDEFKKERDSYLGKGGYQKPSEPRYTQHEELKYLLRSLDKHFPNYNKVYLVVKDGQFPTYLKRDNPRLQVVNHSEIMPKEYLPTFNSRAIEMYLHRIPNLSEYYLYSNDDFVITKDIDKSFYFDQNGKPYVLLTGLKIHNSSNNVSKLNYESNGFMCGLEFNSDILNKISKK